MSRVVVSSHWDARTSRIHGEEYASYGEALAAIEALVASDDITVEDVDGETQSWLVYPSEEDAESDRDGHNPGAAVAGISVVREEDGT